MGGGVAPRTFTGRCTFRAHGQAEGCTKCGCIELSPSGWLVCSLQIAQDIASDRVVYDKAK
jgi:hypothetical protein